MKTCYLYCVLFALIIVSTFTCHTQAQFFTKTSKSIPRMGRRADNLIASEQVNPRNPNKLDKESTTNLDSLKSFVTSLVEIPKFIQDSVLYYRYKLRKRSK